MIETVKNNYLPPNCSFTKNNWNVLAGFWHPVAYSSEVLDKPMRQVLLDERLVIYRTTQGVSVARDVCPHRGTSISMGWIENDNIVCPYHGLHFNAAGQCTLIPAEGPEAKISPKLCLHSYPVVERYGIVWTCLKPEAKYPLPEWPVYDDPDKQKYKCSAIWAASASRHAENFNDVGHFSWIHAGTFGDRNDPLVNDYKVEQTEYGFHREIKVKQIDRDTFSGDATTTINDYIYDYVFPFASSLQVKSEDGKNEWIYDAICPITIKKSKIFIIKIRDYDLGEMSDEWIEFQDAINLEDQAIIEDQHPEWAPLDVSQEFHIKGDAWSIAFRKKWKELGLEGPMAA